MYTVGSLKEGTNYKEYMVPRPLRTVGVGKPFVINKLVHSNGKGPLELLWITDE